MTPSQKSVKIIRNVTLTSVQGWGHNPWLRFLADATMQMVVTWEYSNEEHEQLSFLWERYIHTITAAHTPSCWVRSLKGIQPHTTVLLSSMSRGNGDYAEKWMVFYDNHAVSAKQINLFHAFYPHCRQLQERGTWCWKACFTDTVREQSDIT